MYEYMGVAAALKLAGVTNMEGMFSMGGSSSQFTAPSGLASLPVGWKTSICWLFNLNSYWEIITAPECGGMCHENLDKKVTQCMNDKASLKAFSKWTPATAR